MSHLHVGERKDRRAGWGLGNLGKRGGGRDEGFGDGFELVFYFFRYFFSPSRGKEVGFEKEEKKAYVWLGQIRIKELSRCKKRLGASRRVSDLIIHLGGRHVLGSSR